MQHRARKRFGQNFLVDDGVIGQILDACDPKAQDVFVEVGPGQGALTERLMSLCERLYAIEIDRDLVDVLQEKYDVANFHLINQDVLAVDFSEISPGRPLRLLGNLPYNISTPLLFHLFDSIERFDDLTVMLQNEVAERLAAQPGSKAYGRLSVMAQYFCQIETLFLVRPESFEPVPKVISAVVRLIPHRPMVHEVLDFVTFEKVVRLAFGQRRKMLRNNLKGVVKDADYEKAGIAPDCRAETLSVGDFVRLVNCLF